MTDRSLPRVNKLPFIIADVVLVLLAAWIVKQQPHPLSAWPLVLTVLCVAGACAVALLPFRMEYDARLKLAETAGLTTTVAEINRLREAAEHIRHATSQWQGVQEQSGLTVNAAREVADRITAEAKDFASFLQKANDAEKTHLRLEVEKMRRSEGDWVQVTVRILDHVFALHQAAHRSGQRNVAEQLARFQQACRDAARRIGLLAFEAGADEPFDATKHQLVDPAGTAPAGVPVIETLACGFTYQGQLLRRALVRLAEPGSAPAAQPAAVTEIIEADEAAKAADVAEAAPSKPAASKPASAVAATASASASGPASAQKELLLQPEPFPAEEPPTGGA